MIYFVSKNMQSATLISKRFLNDHVIELKLQTKKLFTQPGQWLFIHYLESKTPLKRAYSIANEEQEGDFSIFTFLIKLIPWGLGSERLRLANEQTTFWLEGPNGHFLLKNTTNPKVFLSTGSGLAPCYRLAKEDKSWSQKRFFFSVSYARDLFYVEDIKRLNIPETHISTSREEVDGFEYGRITIDRYVFPSETEFYICWVPAMVKDFLVKLKAKGYMQIFVEAY